MKKKAVQITNGLGRYFPEVFEPGISTSRRPSRRHEDLQVVGSQNSVTSFSQQLVIPGS